jgi:hypothetical protein
LGSVRATDEREREKYACLPINNVMMEPNRPNEETKKTYPNNAPPETSTVSVSETRAETNYHHAPPTVCPFVHRFAQQLPTVRPSPKRISFPVRRPETKPKRPV